MSESPHAYSYEIPAGHHIVAAIAMPVDISEMVKITNAFTKLFGKDTFVGITVNGWCMITRKKKPGDRPQRIALTPEPVAMDVLRFLNNEFPEEFQAAEEPAHALLSLLGELKQLRKLRADVAESTVQPVINERLRQVRKLNLSRKAGTTSDPTELLEAAACYLILAAIRLRDGAVRKEGDKMPVERVMEEMGNSEEIGFSVVWPWERDWFKPGEIGAFRDIVKGAALATAAFEWIADGPERGTLDYWLMVTGSFQEGPRRTWMQRVREITIEQDVTMTTSETALAKNTVQFLVASFFAGRTPEETVEEWKLNPMPEGDGTPNEEAMHVEVGVADAPAGDFNLTEMAKESGMLPIGHRMEVDILAVYTGEIDPENPLRAERALTNSRQLEPDQVEKVRAFSGREMFGNVMPFGEWIGKQTEYKQRQILGDKFELYRSGELDFTEVKYVLGSGETGIMKMEGDYDRIWCFVPDSVPLEEVRGALAETPETPPGRTFEEIREAEPDRQWEKGEGRFEGRLVPVLRDNEKMTIFGRVVEFDRGQH